MAGFVYLWYDVKRKWFYVGSHMGSVEDGYVCSNKQMINAYKKRPHDFKRRIIERITTTHDDLLKAEQRWLDMINDTELSTGINKTNNTIRYYNVKKNAAGGNGKIGSNGVLRGKVKYYDPVTLKQKLLIEGTAPEGWIKGVPDNKKSSSLTQWIHHPTLKQNRRVKNITDELISNGWVAGRLMSETLKTAMSNGGKKGILKVNKSAPRTGKPIITPYGEFDKIKSAATALGIQVTTVWARVNNTNMPDWHYKE